MPLVPQEAIWEFVREDFKPKLKDFARSNESTTSQETPVFVDFENSVVEPPSIPNDRVASKIHRPSYRGPLKLLKKLSSPMKEATVKNVRRLISELKSTSDHPRVLIVGGGSIGKGMDPIYQDSAIELIAFDIYWSPNVQFLADAHDIPIQNDTFDGVVVQAVLEHVLDPSIVAAEIFRVLKPGGLLYAETPFMQQVHEGPFDFTRFTESGHRHLFSRFERIDSGSNGGPGLQFMWSVDYLFRGLFRSRTAGKIAKLCVFWAQYLDRIIPEPYRVDGASGVFFLGRKTNRRLPPKELVSHYLGAQ